MCDECNKLEIDHGQAEHGGSEHEYKDENGDGICDSCDRFGVEHQEGNTEHPFRDADGDKKCDECAKSEYNHGAFDKLQHIDADGDGMCDLCKEPDLEEKITGLAESEYYHSLRPEQQIEFAKDSSTGLDTGLVCFTAFTPTPGVGDTEIVFEFDDGIWDDKQMTYSIDITNLGAYTEFSFSFKLIKPYLDRFVFTKLVFTPQGSVSYFDHQAQIEEDGMGFSGKIVVDNATFNDLDSWVHVRVYCGLKNLEDCVKIEDSKGSVVPLSVVSQGVFRFYPTDYGRGLYTVAVEFNRAVEVEAVYWKALKNGKNYVWDIFSSWGSGRKHYFTFRLETLNEMLDLFPTSEGVPWQNNCRLIIRLTGGDSSTEFSHWSSFFEVEKDNDVSFIFIQNDDGTITLYFWTESGNLDVSFAVDGSIVSQGIISSDVGGKSGSVTFEFELCEIEGYRRVWTIVKSES